MNRQACREVNAWVWEAVEEGSMGQVGRDRGFNGRWATFVRTKRAPAPHLAMADRHSRALELLPPKGTFWSVYLQARASSCGVHTPDVPPSGFPRTPQVAACSRPAAPPATHLRAADHAVHRRKGVPLGHASLQHLAADGVHRGQLALGWGGEAGKCVHTVYHVLMSCMELCQGRS